MRATAKGITALDLLITMALVALLAVTGIPGLREYSLNQQMKSAIASLHADLNLARNDAISLDATTIACPGSTVTGCTGQSRWQPGWLVFVDLNGDRAWQQTEPVLRTANELENMTVRSPASRHQVRFFPGGSAPGSNSSIIFCDQRGFRGGRKLVISNSGRIRRSMLNESDQASCPSL